MEGQIPVSFEFKGKEYKGYLSKVSGSGTTASYHLMVSGYYWGQLSNHAGHRGFAGGLHAIAPGWRFDSPTHPELSALAEYFGYVLSSWLDSHS